ncbi:MAG: DsbA family protein [Nitrospirales bacterium]|nr:DsbA family protein [Nitrospira sp.]MDR4486537.1 DsbA family protein [Nitrospirales bacterium]
MPFHPFIIRTILLASFLTGNLLLSPFISFADPPADTSDPAFQKALENVVEQYIITHLEIIELTLQGLQAKRQAEERERVRKTIATRQEDLLNDPNSPVSGNLKGDVTVVEFFDYRCGYCNRVAGTVTQLQKDDPDVRVVYKDFPILGEHSVYAAKAALASQAQGQHLVFHEALLASDQELTEDTVLFIARTVGLDTARLTADMKSPDIQDHLDRNQSLARELGIQGTPGFIVGSELAPGAMSLEDLKSLIASLRNQQGQPSNLPESQDRP